MMRAGHTIRTILLIGAVAVAFSACGRRPSTLDTPYEAEVEAREQAEKDGQQPLPPAPEKPAEDRPFILDSLI